MKTLSRFALTVALLTPAFAQQDFSKVEIKAIPVAKNIYLLEGSGGNIGVSVGTDGNLIVDDQFAPLAEKIDAALQKPRQTQIRPQHPSSRRPHRRQRRVRREGRDHHRPEQCP
jgi:hypothetical protein